MAVERIKLDEDTVIKKFLDRATVTAQRKADFKKLADETRYLYYIDDYHYTKTLNTNPKLIWRWYCITYNGVNWLVWDHTLTQYSQTAVGWHAIQGTWMNLPRPGSLAWSGSGYISTGDIGFDGWNNKTLDLDGGGHCHPKVVCPFLYSLSGGSLYRSPPVFYDQWKDNAGSTGAFSYIYAALGGGYVNWNALNFVRAPIAIDLGLSSAKTYTTVTVLPFHANMKKYSAVDGSVWPGGLGGVSGGVSHCLSTGTDMSYDQETKQYFVNQALTFIPLALDQGYNLFNDYPFRLWQPSRQMAFWELSSCYNISKDPVQAFECTIKKNWFTLDDVYKSLIDESADPDSLGSYRIERYGPLGWTPSEPETSETWVAREGYGLTYYSTLGVYIPLGLYPLPLASHALNKYMGTEFKWLVCTFKAGPLIPDIPADAQIFNYGNISGESRVCIIEITPENVAFGEAEEIKGSGMNIYDAIFNFYRLLFSPRSYNGIGTSRFFNDCKIILNRDIPWHRERFFNVVDNDAKIYPDTAGMKEWAIVEAMSAGVDTFYLKKQRPYSPSEKTKRWMRSHRWRALYWQAVKEIPDYSYTG